MDNIAKPYDFSEYGEDIKPYISSVASWSPTYDCDNDYDSSTMFVNIRSRLKESQPSQWTPPVPTSLNKSPPSQPSAPERPVQPPAPPSSPEARPSLAAMRSRLHRHRIKTAINALELLLNIDGHGHTSRADVVQKAADWIKSRKDARLERAHKRLAKVLGMPQHEQSKAQVIEAAADLIAAHKR